MPVRIIIPPTNNVQVNFVQVFFVLNDLQGPGVRYIPPSDRLLTASQEAFAYGGLPSAGREILYKVFPIQTLQLLSKNQNRTKVKVCRNGKTGESTSEKKSHNKMNINFFK